jgi:NAD(P)-dependent dehydrogenase (short-subunit alcohol dehydrogenase family)
MNSSDSSRSRCPQVTSLTREVGRVAVFLASNDSSFVNGVELFVDGGMAQMSDAAACEYVRGPTSFNIVLCAR